MRILSVDLGEARTGIAVSDEGERLGKPVKTIRERDWNKLIQEIKGLAESLGAGQIVVGHPLNLDCTAGHRAQLSRDFAQRLREATGLPVVLWDERNTTVAATYYLSDCGIRGEKRKQLIDQVAAMLILESYLRWRALHPGEEEPNGIL